MGSSGREITHRIAMLIDGDNAQASLIDKMMVEVTKYGVATVRRIYGDWTDTSMNQWKKILHNHAIQPVQQFRYTVGKNATDSALIIDAMDLLHGERLDSFCIVSSDSDYTRLATRIREAGLFVIGMGKRSTPEAFIAACHVFVYVENLDVDIKLSAAPQVSASAKNVEAKSEPHDPLPLLLTAFESAVQEDGWVMLSTLGNVLHQLDPSFDARSYGYKGLGQLLRAFPDEFEMSESSSHVRRRLDPEAYSVEIALPDDA